MGRESSGSLHIGFDDIVIEGRDSSRKESGSEVITVTLHYNGITCVSKSC